MKNRHDMTAVIEGLNRDHGLLAAFLEATDKIDWRALHRRPAAGDLSQAVNVEAHPQTSAAPKFPDSPFAFRRANLVRAPE